MDDRLSEASVRELERVVEMKFAAAAALPGADSFLTTPFIPIPAIGGKFFAGFEPHYLRLQVVAALVARERFRLSAPSWAPALPLSYEDIAVMENADSPQLQTVGLYAGSLRWTYWDPAHPCFASYVSGVLAHPTAPDDLRNDLELQKQFPAKELPGLGAKLSWSGAHLQG